MRQNKFNKNQFNKNQFNKNQFNEFNRYIELSMIQAEVIYYGEVSVYYEPCFNDPVSNQVLQFLDYITICYVNRFIVIDVSSNNNVILFVCSPYFCDMCFNIHIYSVSTFKLFFTDMFILCIDIFQNQLTNSKRVIFDMYKRKII